jgi:Arc-like DNA binding domain
MEHYQHGQDRKPMNLRVPWDLYQQLQAEAQGSERSLSREIIWRLRQSFAAARDEEASAA